MAAVAGCRSGLGDADQLFVVTADGEHRQQVTRDDVEHGSPSWSPDGRRIAFSSSTCGELLLEVADSDGKDRSTLLRRRRAEAAARGLAPSAADALYERLTE